MRKLFALMSLLVLASMVLAACGGGAPSTQPPAAATEPPAAATEPPATGATEPPAAATGPKSADPTTLNLADADVSIDTLDPALAYDTASGEIIQNTYDTLVFYDRAAIDKFVPLLAESWEQSDDGKTFTFKIRSGVNFHNGDEMTPTDVAYSFQRGLLQGGTPPRSGC